MPFNLIITSRSVGKLKQSARKLKREAGISHVEALDKVANTLGLAGWHQIAKAANNFEPTEQAYYFGLLIAFDLKEGMDFQDVSDNFKNDPYAYVLCEEDIINAYYEADDEDGIPLIKKYSKAELSTWAKEELGDLMFFRYVGNNIPPSLNQAMSMIAENSFWLPEFVWLRGGFYERPTIA